MTLVQHRDITKLLPGQYFRLSPRELGWFVRKGLLDCKPRLGYERLTNVPGVWVTWFAGAYEIRRYSHGINSGAIPVEVLCPKKLLVKVNKQTKTLKSKLNKSFSA